MKRTVRKIERSKPWILVLMIPFFLLSSASNFHSESNPDEICDNGIDDDNDGLIDLNDPDCECEIIEPVSLIPNPSFEEMDCCPNNRSQLDCATGWIQASEPTTDFIHSCDWFGWENFPPPTPFPDGEGIMGFRDGRITSDNEPRPNWKEYAGACLLQPLIKDTTYRFEFDVGFVDDIKSPPINITFFGTTDCQYLPFGVGDNRFGCPTNGPNWINLGSTNVNGRGGDRWVKANINVTPDQDIYAIAIGPDCPFVNTEVSLYYFFDNLLLDDLRSFEFKITEVNHPCSEDFKLKVPDNSAYSYQWYKEGIALLNETAAELTQIYGEGNYQVRIEDGSSCLVSSNFEVKFPFETSIENETICHNANFSFGDNLLTQPGTYLDTFKNQYNCDSIVSLNLNVLGLLADTVSAKIFSGQSYPIENNTYTTEGEHLARIPSAIGCDSLVLLQLSYYRVFTPNVFSPNGDNINDYFTIFGEEDNIQEFEIHVYDRWGSKMFTGQKWDGSKNGARLNTGVFVYHIRLKMRDGRETSLNGSVTLLR